MAEIRKLLIANRGEIACRIARTAREMGIATVAIYSDADAKAAHVAACDEAVHIGPAPAAESYLKIDKVIEAAKRTGAQAVHPGYGFLAENAEFADALAAADLIFVGPPASAIRAMGGKSAAKALMAEADVPLVPGYHGDDQSPEHLAKQAEQVGFPLLIKASAGGGGKGMKVVESAAEFAAGLESAKREALAAFSDDHVLLERYLAKPRHVEIQVLADREGRCIHLFERDCSIQRRHQKVVEEAPAPGLDQATREAMGAAAVRAAQAINYVGAGTVEFLLDEDGSFYFMEMNTRLQVEHPVTEAITGLDLVEWQLRVAAGEPLPGPQFDLTATGHAVEVRLYAEDPARGFLPQIGTVARFDVPAGEGLRVDAGIRAGDAVTPFYDPMIAKLIAWGPSRDAAIERLSDMLAGTRLTGLNGNLGFLRRVVDHPAFRDAQLDTRFIEQHEADLLGPGPQPTATVLIAAALAVAGLIKSAAGPWAADGWLLNLDRQIPLNFTDAAGGDHAVTLKTDGRALTALIGEEAHEVSGFAPVALGWSFSLNGHNQTIAVDRQGDTLSIRDAADGRWYDLTYRNPLAVPEAEAAAAGGLTAPMPGKVTTVMVTSGTALKAGDPILVLEAMKMEHVIKAPTDGTVTDLPFAEGDQVEEGVALVGFDAVEAG
ncbi:MAG: acetyl-CoA carboxylase biotin carboxylase subunit [Alphaproteobacteria bacterium]|nr:acetyl-CoA carboxylase biotin carboxylase subunit [Alphaproteobacteria bacterium SS10]